MALAKYYQILAAAAEASTGDHMTAAELYSKAADNLKAKYGTEDVEVSELIHQLVPELEYLPQNWDPRF